MNIEPQYLGIIIVILAHAGTSIWWASKINTSMVYNNELLRTLQKALIAHETMKYSKEEAVKDFALRDKQIDAIWKKLDSLHA